MVYLDYVSGAREIRTKREFEHNTHESHTRNDDAEHESGGVDKCRALSFFFLKI